MSLRVLLLLPVLAVVWWGVASPSAAAPPSWGDEVFDLNERAREALDEGRPHDAVKLLEKARGIEPEDEVLGTNLAYAYYRRGIAYSEQFHMDSALRDLKLATDIDGTEPGYPVHHAHLLLRLYRLTEAERILWTVVKQHTKKADAWLLLGDVLNLLDRLDEAMTAYERAAKYGSGDVARHAGDALARTTRQYEVERDYLTDLTESFVIRHPHTTSGPLWGTQLASLLERARAEVCNELDYFPQQRTIVVLYTPEQFQRVTGAHEWVGGLFDRKIRLPIGDVRREADRIESSFRHEFAHLIVSELAPSCPALVNEGLAQMVEFGRGQGIPRLVDYLDRRGGRDDLPYLADLPESFIDLADRDQASIAYLVSFAFVDHVVTMHGGGAIVRWIGNLATHPLDQAFSRAVGRSLADEERLFRQMVRTTR